MRTIFVPIFFLISVNSFSYCNFSLTSSGVNETIGSVNIETAQTLTVSRPSSTSQNDCGNAYFFFSKGTANSYTRKAFNSLNEGLNYNLYKGTSGFGTLKDAFDFGSSNEYLTRNIPTANIPTISQFYFFLPAIGSGAMVRGGIYTDNVSINVYRGGINSNFAYYEFSRTLPITIIVPKIINLSLVDSGQAIDLNSAYKNLDFGVLETNEEMNFDLMVASNAGYKISFSSLNNGKLDNASKGVKIDYALKVSGSTINLSTSSSSPVLVASGSGVTGNSGARLPVNVKIGVVNDSQWGDYQDYITITAATND